MKYCCKCGSELCDEAIVCPNCGCAANNPNETKTNNSSSGLLAAAKVFMIINCCVLVISAIVTFFIYAELDVAYLGILEFIPLMWCIPMTVTLDKKIKNNQPISVAFKVCTLLFANLVSGILLLCAKDN